MVDIMKKSKQNDTFVLGEDAFMEAEVKTKPKPKAKLFSQEESVADLKEMIDELPKFNNDSNVFKEIKQNVKRQLKITKYKKELTLLLKLYKTKSNDYDDEKALDDIIQLIEDKFYISNKEECNKIKLDLALDVLKPYFTDLTESRLIKRINKSCQTVIKSTFWRRNNLKLLKITGFFLQIVQAGK